MEKIAHTLTMEGEQIEFVPIGDLHDGNPNSKFKLFKEFVDYVEKTPDCYTILMGDLIDAIAVNDPRYDPRSVDSMIDECIDRVEDAIAPLAKKGKVLAALQGNHEWKLEKHGIGNPIKRMCRRLDMPYGDYSCFIKLKVVPKTHKPSLVIYTHHGHHAGRKTGSSVNNVEGLAQHWAGDVFLVGHAHQLWGTRKVRTGWGGSRKLVFANTGSFLETASMGTCSYAERAGYPPTKLGCVKIKWFPLRDDIHISE